MLGLSRDNRLITLSLLLWGLGEGLFFFVQPWYIGELGASPTQIGGVLALAGVVTAATYLPGGIISDRLDRKLTMIGGFAIGSVAVLVMALARHWQTLVPGLLLYATSGYCIPAIYSYVTHASEGEDLTRTLMTVFAAYSLGLTPSPAIGGWLVELVGMRLTYVVAAGCFMAATLVVSRVARQPKPDGSQLMAGRELAKNRTFLVLSAVFMSVYFVTYLGQPFAPNYLAEVTGLRLGWIGFLGSAHALGAFVLGLALGRWRAGPRWGLIAAQGLVGLSFVLLLRTNAIGPLSVAFFLRGAYASTRSLASAWIGDVLGRQSLGLAYGVLSTVFGIANVVAPYAAGWLYAARPALPFLVAAAAVPATMLLTGAVGFGDRQPAEAVGL
ncbi:MAG: MFS transporter [Anaerolineae bacterium]